MSDNLDSTYAHLTTQKDTGQPVELPSNPAARQEIEQLFALENRLLAEAKHIKPPTELLQRILRSSVTLASDNRYTKQKEQLYTFPQYMKNVLILGSIVAAVIVAVLVHVQISGNKIAQAPLPVSSEQSGSTPTSITSPEAPAYAATDESIETILAALDMWSTEEQGTVALADTSSQDPDIINEDQALNAFDQETTTYANEL